jgi:hypothetical protein
MSLDNKKELRQDVPTKWNSTYLMLESAIHYRCVFSYLEMIDSNFKHCPTALEWEKVNDIGTFFACFYFATCEFSGTKYPTANLYFPAVFTIYVTLKQQLESKDVYKKSMTTQMLSKFEKYWSKFSVVLAILVILDPRFNLNFVNYIYTRLYGVSEFKEYLHVCKKLFFLFTEYNGSSSTTPSTITVEKHVHSQQSSKPSSKLMKIK